MNNYSLIYDFGNRTFNFSIIIFIFLFAAVGFGAIFYEWKNNRPDFMKIIKKGSKELDSQSRRIKLGFLFIWTGFATILALVTASFQITTYNHLKDIYHRKAFQVIQGKVEKFIPMPFGGHGSEQFEINGTHFDYSPVDGASYGYSITSNNGGAIREGIYVRIGFIERNSRKLILKLEVQNN